MHRTDHLESSEISKSATTQNPAETNFYRFFMNGYQLKTAPCPAPKEHSRTARQTTFGTRLSRFFVGLAFVAIQLSGINDAKAQYNDRSAVSCDSWARNYAQQHSARGQIFGGGFVGSLLGLGVGAATGGAGLALGAAIGGSAGIIGGGMKRSQVEGQIYNAAYTDCMRGRIP